MLSFLVGVQFSVLSSRIHQTHRYRGHHKAFLGSLPLNSTRSMFRVLFFCSSISPHQECEVQKTDRTQSSTKMAFNVGHTQQIFCSFLTCFFTAFLCAREHTIHPTLCMLSVSIDDNFQQSLNRNTHRALRQSIPAHQVILYPLESLLALFSRSSTITASDRAQRVFHLDFKWCFNC